MLRCLRKGHFHSACNLITLFVCTIMWAARECTALYFHAYDYPSWVSTVMVFRNTSIMRDTGWLQMNPYTNATVGRALYKTTFQIKNSTNGSLSSFKTSFVFSMNTDRGREYFGDGLAFLICPNPFRGEDLQVSSGGYLGMFNSTTNGLLKNRVFAVEFDTHKNTAFRDPNDNHIGVDINSVLSLKTNNLSTLGIILNQGKRIICWVDYDGDQRYLQVYLALSPAGKPSSPAIAMALDLAPYMKDNMYVGFSSATGTRAELHTIFSWWFLAGFGNLTFPVSSSPSSRSPPLASLGQRSIVIGSFSLAAVIGFFSFFCIYARRRWQKQSKHLIDILLPVACWMYWKESITCEMRSMRCLKLATPTVELLAWLWRTRLARKYAGPQVKAWPEVSLKRKMGPHYRGEAWQLESKKRKRHKRRGAFHVMVYEEENDNADSGEEDETLGRVTKHLMTSQVPERKSDEGEAVKRKEGPGTGFPLPLKQLGKDRPSLETEELARSILKARAKGKDKDSKSYVVECDSFVVVGEERDAQIFQRRGSFLIPQGAPDGHELSLEPVKEVHAVVGQVQPQSEESARQSKGKIAKGRVHLLPETAYISTTDDPAVDKFYTRRGSFCVHPEDVLAVVGAQSAEGDEKEPLMQSLVEQNISSMKIERGIDVRRGSFSVDPEVAIKLTDGPSTGKRKEPSMQSLAEQDIASNSSKRRIDARRGSSIVVEDAGSSSKPAGDHTKQSVDHRIHDHFDAADASLNQSVDPEVAIKHTKSREREDPSVQYLVKQDIASPNERRIDARRGSFIVVEDTGSSPKQRVSDHAKRSVNGRFHYHSDGADASSNKFVDPEAAIKHMDSRSAEKGKEPSMQYLVEQDIAGTKKRRIDLRRGSFIIVEDAVSSSKPGADDHTKQSVHHRSVGYNSDSAEASSNQSVDIEAAIKHTDSQSAEKGIEPSMQCLVEQEFASANKRKIYVRRGSFIVAGSSSTPGAGDHTKQSVDHRSHDHSDTADASSNQSADQEVVSKHTDSASMEEGKEPSMHYLVEQDIASTNKKRSDARRGSFILVKDAASSSKPGAGDHTKQSIDHKSHILPDAAEASSEQSSKFAPISDDGGKSHVTHHWLFD